MDDLEFWGTDGEGGGLSMRDEWQGDEELAAQLMHEEHAMQDVPAVTVLLHRVGLGCTEVLWINGYPRIKRIVITALPVRIDTGHCSPGTVRTVPVRWQDMASADTFRDRVERHAQSYIDMGWVRKDPAAAGTVQ